MENQGSGGAGKTLTDWLERLEVGECRSANGMALYSVFWCADASPMDNLNYRTLAEALAEGWVEVVERPSASVPELVLRNKGAAMVLVLDGEEIVGGKQNRIINASFLVAAGTEATLPVSCVEHGRWHDVSARFSAGEAAFPALRRDKTAQVNMNLRATGQRNADQSAVWERVAERAQSMHAPSQTGAMYDIYRHGQEGLQRYEQAFPYAEGALGLVVAIGGRLVGADIFDQPRTARLVWGKLVRSYALDVLDALDAHSHAAGHQNDALEFLKRITTARLEVYPSLALGEDVRIEGNGVVGAALVYSARPVHVGLFPADEPGTSAMHDMGIARSSFRARMRTERP